MKESLIANNIYLSAGINEVEEKAINKNALTKKNTHFFWLLEEIIEKRKASTGSGMLYSPTRNKVLKESLYCFFFLLLGIIMNAEIYEKIYKIYLIFMREIRYTQ